MTNKNYTEPSQEEIEAAALAWHGWNTWGDETVGYIKACRENARTALIAAARERERSWLWDDPT